MKYTDRHILVNWEATGFATQPSITKVEGDFEIYKCDQQHVSGSPYSKTIQSLKHRVRFDNSEKTKTPRFIWALQTNE